MSKLTTYELHIKQHFDMEERKRQLEPLKVDLIDFSNRNHHGYLISDSAEHQDVNSGIRTAIIAVAILLLVAIAWYYSPAINYILQGGVK